MDVELPDGTIIEDVPDGTTQAEIMKRFSFMKASPYGPTKMAEVSSVPDGYDIDQSPEMQAQDDPGILSRLFNPPGGIGEAGPPPLTPEEGKAALGILGSTVGTALAPELAVPAMISKAKYLGPVASFFTKNAAKVPAAGIGGAGGEASADVVQGNPVDPKQALETAAEYGGAEAFGSGVARAADKALAPAAGKLTDQALKLLKFSQKENIPIGAGALVPGMTEKIIKGGTDNFIPSRLVNQHYRGKLVHRMNELMATIPEGVGQVLGKEESSLVTTEAFRAAANTKQAMAKKLRNEFLESIGPQTEIKAANTISKLKAIQSQAKDKNLRDFIELELATVNKGSKTAEELETTLNQINQIKPRGADKKFLSEIREAVQADFKAASADMEKLSNSSNFFKMNAELLSHPLARRLMKENLTSSQMTAQIFRAGNEGFVKKLGKELPQETWDSLRAQNLANLLENFSRESDKMPGVRVLTDGDKLVKWIENNKTVLDAAYDPKTIEALENFAQLARATKGEVANFNEGAVSLASLGLTGALGGAKYSEPATLIFTTPMLMGVAKSMMNPDGWVKQWLTTGFKGGREIGEAAKLGGRTAVSGEDDD